MAMLGIVYDVITFCEVLVPDRRASCILSILVLSSKELYFFQFFVILVPGSKI